MDDALVVAEDPVADCVWVRTRHRWPTRRPLVAFVAFVDDDGDEEGDWGRLLPLVDDGGGGRSAIL